MTARRKLAIENDPEDTELRKKALSVLSTNAERAALEKDFHLIEAALALDKTIVSVDESARKLLEKSATRVGPLRQLTWINPETGRSAKINPSR